MNCHGQDGVNQVGGCFPVSVFRDLASLKLDHNCLPHSMLKEIEKRRILAQFNCKSHHGWNFRDVEEEKKRESVAMLFRHVDKCACGKDFSSVRTEARG